MTTSKSTKSKLVPFRSRAKRVDSLAKHLRTKVLMPVMYELLTTHKYWPKKDLNKTTVSLKNHKNYCMATMSFKFEPDAKRKNMSTSGPVWWGSPYYRFERKYHKEVRDEIRRICEENGYKPDTCSISRKEWSGDTMTAMINIKFKKPFDGEWEYTDTKSLNYPSAHDMAEFYAEAVQEVGKDATSTERSVEGVDKL
jgi:hypothetical protein